MSKRSKNVSVGDVNGRLTIVAFVRLNGAAKIWEAVCECGNKRVLLSQEFRKGIGCLECSLEIRGDSRSRHGDTRRGHLKRLYRIWSGMRSRCADKKNKWYGGKGIKLCQEWQSDYAAFRSWAMANGYQEWLSIDRIDTSKDYSPENCQWITVGENSRRRQTGKMFDVHHPIEMFFGHC